MISNFINPEDGAYAKWNCDGIEVIVKSLTRVLATPLKTGDRVVVIDMHSSAGIDNAKIVACDGTEITRIRNPFEKEGVICFEDVFYVGDELTLIAAFPERQVACVVNEHGAVVRTYETR